MNQSLPHYHNVQPKKWYQQFFSRHIDYNKLLDRKIITNIPDPLILTNRIQTSKYNYFTFVPINLLQQFTKPANIYFLLIGILQIIPAITLSQGRPTIFVPLFMVVIISMIKDFIQDLKRHRNDQQQNESQIQMLTPIGFVKRQWQDLKVGNIIRVHKDQYLPCDIILLDHNKEQKTTYIETKNLDGQTNLKLKKVSEHLQHLREKTQINLSNIRLQFSFQKPNPFLSTFNGNYSENDMKFMIDSSNVILRGCSLKINQWAIGLCVYTGHESKIMLNSGSQKMKTSQLQSHLNNYFRRIFIFQIGATLISAMCYGVTFSVHHQNQGYIAYNENVIIAGLTTWGSWFVSFSSFIPISLYVTVEMVRFFQGKLLNKDQLCSSKGQFAEVQSSNLNQQLGQIQYVMTDKTGTLTQNLMEFKALYVNGQYYGGNSSEQQMITERQSQITQRSLIEQQEQFSRFDSTVLFKKIANVDFLSTQKLKIIEQIKLKTPQGLKLRQSLIHLALCHNVLSQKNQYSSSSPDELALVSFAKYIGYEFIEKNDSNELVIKQQLEKNQQHFLKYKLLHVLDFSSERKRMSVIVEDLNCGDHNDHPVLLLTKGADQIIIPRTQAYSLKKQNNSELVKVQEALSSYACQGLRTLLLAQKELDRFIFNKWDKNYREALTMIGPERNEILQKLQSNIQKQIKIVAATAIQDKLQSCVKQTIEGLKKSNIKVWMLTGDKKQTAISIGYSCGLLDKDSQKITLDCSAEHANSLLTNLDSMLHLLKNKKVTIVSGQFIRKIDSQSRIILQKILKQSQSVICCRVSPKDKQFITKMVKKWGRTLAIGDGANDVNMINSANVGVGVRGIEGSQATRAADYIITEFKLLKRLITYHGLNFYHRNSNVMLYTLYKNMILTLPNLFYGPLSLESATYIYQIWIVQFYNVFFVSLPIVYYGIFDILYSYNKIKNNPTLYSEGQQSKFFNNNILIRLLLQTMMVSIYLVYSIFFATELTLCENGRMVYFQWSGNLVMAVVVLSCNIRIILMSHQFNIMQGFLCFIGPALYFLLYYLVGIVIDTDSQNTLSHQMSTSLYWILLIFSCFVIEGIVVVQSTILNLKKVVKNGESNKKKILKEFKNRKDQIQLPKLQEPKQFQLIGDMIKQKKQAGGYAFAQDQNRMTIGADIFASQKHKNIVT